MHAAISFNSEGFGCLTPLSEKYGLALTAFAAWRVNLSAHCDTLSYCALEIFLLTYLLI